MKMITAIHEFAVVHPFWSGTICVAVGFSFLLRIAMGKMDAATEIALQKHYRALAEKHPKPPYIVTERSS